jgi:hypothetical protein
MIFWFVVLFGVHFFIISSFSFEGARAHLIGRLAKLKLAHPDLPEPAKQVASPSPKNVVHHILVKEQKNCVYYPKITKKKLASRVRGQKSQ